MGDRNSISSNGKWSRNKMITTDARIREQINPLINTKADIMNINIQFNPDGTAHCLWTDAISLHQLGRLEITRASQIEFNNLTQQWEVIDRKGRIRFFARSRSACLEWEEQHLQAT
jgi:hypothetical protein